MFSFQPNHLNLDLERPDFKGIDSLLSVQPTKDDKLPYVTYEELQRKNREQYAIKHTRYY